MISITIKFAWMAKHLSTRKSVLAFGFDQLHDTSSTVIPKHIKLSEPAIPSWYCMSSKAW